MLGNQWSTVPYFLTKVKSTTMHKFTGTVQFDRERELLIGPGSGVNFCLGHVIVCGSVIGEVKRLVRAA